MRTSTMFTRRKLIAIRNLTTIRDWYYGSKYKMPATNNEDNETDELGTKVSLYVKKADVAVIRK